MKKLYRKGTVHPSPPIISDHLSFLPATILTLTVGLSPEDREVLAYLISCSNHSLSVDNFQSQRRKNTTTTTTQKSSSAGAGAGASLAKSKSSSSNNNDHPPLFNCDCFRCYMSYWVRWDASPNRQLIHEIIDGFEDELLRNKKKVKSNKKDKKKKGGGNYNNDSSGELNRPSSDRQLSLGKEQSAESKSSGETSGTKDGEKGFDGHHHEEGEERGGSVKSFVSFIGEKIWGGVWG